MNENIDLTKILKDCPIGWPLWSSVYGDVEFIEIYRKPVLRTRENEWLGQEIHDCNHNVRFWTTDGIEHSVSSRGEMIKGRGECTLFPSREQRDWSKFTAPWYKNEKFDPKTLQPFDKVIARSYCDDEWDCDIFSHINQEYSFHYVCIGQAWKCCIPYNDDTKHIVGTKEEAPEYYRYWED